MPKRAGIRTMVPTTWEKRTLRVENIDAHGKGKETTGEFIDWTPSGYLLRIAGAVTLISYERVVLMELVD